MSNKWLDDLAENMTSQHANGMAPSPTNITIREFIGHFSFLKRTPNQVRHIKNDLEKLDLRTVPDFELGWIDSEISIELDVELDTKDVSTTTTSSEPTIRIGALDSANRKPKSVFPDDPLVTATTIMQLNDFSQLPVMQNEHNVKGVISWKTIGNRVSLGLECQRVRNCMDAAVEINIEAPIFDATEIVAENGYVLVRGNKGEITGIVTASDLARQFSELAYPFMIIGEVERFLYNLVYRKFTSDDLKEAASDSEVDNPGDLTLGGYCQLLGKPERWDKLGLNIDRVEFTKHLDLVRQMRNDIMHFNLDGLDTGEIQKLRDITSFFRNLARMKAV